MIRKKTVVNEKTKYNCLPIVLDLADATTVTEQHTIKIHVLSILYIKSLIVSLSQWLPIIVGKVDWSLKLFDKDVFKKIAIWI